MKILFALIVMTIGAAAFADNNFPAIGSGIFTMTTVNFAGTTLPHSPKACETTAKMSIIQNADMTLLVQIENLSAAPCAQTTDLDTRTYHMTRVDDAYCTAGYQSSETVAGSIMDTGAGIPALNLYDFRHTPSACLNGIDGGPRSYPIVGINEAYQGVIHNWETF